MNAIAARAVASTPAVRGQCFHCGESLSTQAWQVEIDGRRESVCCAGCAAAANWIREAGLADYYRLRQHDSNRVDADLGDFRSWDRDDVQRGHVLATPTGCEITLAVEGLRCAACAWLIDRALSREDGVDHVSVNAITGRLRLAWQPQRTRLSHLLATLAGLGYRPHLAGGEALERARRSERNTLLLRLGLALLAATQAMMFSEALYLDSAHEMSLATRDLFRWLTFLVCTPVVVYSGAPFFTGMLREWRQRRVGMDTLAASSIGLAYLASLEETVRGGAQVWFDAAAMFVLFLLTARLLERFARQRAGAQVDLLARAQPALAWRVDGARCEQVPIGELRTNDVVRVPADASVPADGELLDASAAFNEALLTGEATPCRKQRGDRVHAGSIADRQPVQVRVTAIGAATRLSQIQRLVERAQAQRPALARRADRLAGVFVLAMIVAALATFAYWSQHDVGRAFAIGLSVLVAACPCALSLAVPAALSTASDVLAREGVLVIGDEAIERLAGIDTVLLDKTGTLTRGAPTLLRTETFAELDAGQARQWAAALQRDNRHPLASAFGDSDLVAAEQKLHPGLGIEGVLGQRRLRLGRADFAAAGSDDGAVWLGDGAVALARFEVRDALRDDARACVDRLRALGLKVAVISGDAEPAVREICAALAIDDYRSRQGPEDKLARIREWQARGHRVLMLGDGINDAPVLAGADVSMAMGQGSALAQGAADVLLLGERLTRLPLAIALARRTQALIRQNIAWALLYNIVAVAIAAAGWVHPGLAALGMAGSSLLVTLNALRLRRGTATPA